MNYQGYELRNGNKCNCGYEFKINDITKLQRVPESLYGGIVKHISETKCPMCGKETLLLLKQQGQTYVIKGIAQKETVEEVKNTSENEERILEEPKMVSDPVNNTDNELICPVCQKSFKNKSGLTNHMKVH